MKYSVTITQENEAYVVDFPDIPEAHTVIYDLDDLQSEGMDALESALEFYSESKRLVPLPGKVDKSAQAVRVPTTVAAKIHLFNTWLSSPLEKKDIAKAMGATNSTVSRLFDFSHRSKMEAIEQALAVLGKEIEIKVA